MTKFATRLRAALLSTLLLASASLTALASQVNAPVAKETVVFGQKIHYLEAGSGPTVILLHGLGGSSGAWQQNIGPIAEKFHVFALDQIGFGKSDKIERASLVGNSMGGWIAVAFTVAFPDRVDKLVLENAAGYAPPKDFDLRSLYGLNPTTREGMKVLAARVFYNKAFLTDNAIDQALAFRLAAGDGYTIHSIVESILRGEDFLDDTVKTIKRPTLIIWGREDGLVPLADGERFNKEIAGSKLLVFDQCGHVPNIEKALDFNAAVIKFLTGDAQ